ncbi:MAG: PGF-pre-PGF domain-containing protein [Candidatus Methanoperedens sp.]|nr:MAG: PGF-pre-PGF domain-containing protein [Candidatus Methanoperedens sp.]
MRTICMKQQMIISMMLLLLAIPASSAVATITVGAISYDSTVVKDESITISSSVTASTVTGTLTVDVTLTDNSGLFNIPTPVQQLQFTTNGTKAISWTIKATSSGTGAAPFTITGSGDDGSNGVRTSSSAVTVKDRPVISISASSDVSTIATGGSASVSYVVSNDALVGASDATNVNVTLVLPAGWSLSSGTNPYALGSIAPGASMSGSWTVRADSPAASNTLTLNAGSSIPGGTVSGTVSITGPSGSGDGGSSGSGGSGGGGGGGRSGENVSNIEVIEKYDLQISKDALTSYRFTDKKNPMMYVNITGNTTLGIITASVEVLKNTSTLVSFPPEGLVYKNANIWVGTAGFATPKNIKDALIKFRVANSWMSENSVQNSAMVLEKWNGSNWIQLGTEFVSKDDTYSYFEGRTNSFSPFAIVAKAGGAQPAATVTSTPAGTPTPGSTGKPGSGDAGGISPWLIAVIVIVIIAAAVYFLARKKR